MDPPLQEAEEDEDVEEYLERLGSIGEADAFTKQSPCSRSPQPADIRSFFYD